MTTMTKTDKTCMIHLKCFLPFYFPLLPLSSNKSPHLFIYLFTYKCVYVFIYFYLYSFHFRICLDVFCNYLTEYRKLDFNYFLIGIYSVNLFFVL